MLQGLPGSGKSTWAKQQGAIRVNKDDLREMLHNGKWTGSNEKQILRVRDLIVEDALQHGLDVIVDDTNFHPKHGKRLKELADKYHATFIVKLFETPVEECIKRDSKRANPVGRKEITAMYRKYLAKPWPKMEYDPSLEDCILVDVDGTLASYEGVRGPFDFDKSGEDKPNKEIIDVVLAWWHNCNGETPHRRVIVLTGAEEKFRSIREHWLLLHGVPFTRVLMRSTGDFRPDYEIKRELYYEHIAGRYNVRFVLDDRQQVVDMWRELGLRVLQVAEGDF